MSLLLLSQSLTEYNSDHIEHDLLINIYENT